VPECRDNAQIIRPAVQGTLAHARRPGLVAKRSRRAAPGGCCQLDGLWQVPILVAADIFAVRAWQSRSAQAVLANQRKRYCPAISRPHQRHLALRCIPAAGIPSSALAVHHGLTGMTHCIGAQDGVKPMTIAGLSAYTATPGPQALTPTACR